MRSPANAECLAASSRGAASGPQGGGPPMPGPERRARLSGSHAASSPNGIEGVISTDARSAGESPEGPIWEAGNHGEIEELSVSSSPRAIPASSSASSAANTDEPSARCPSSEGRDVSERTSSLTTVPSSNVVSWRTEASNGRSSTADGARVVATEKSPLHVGDETQAGVRVLVAEELAAGGDLEAVPDAGRAGDVPDHPHAPEVPRDRGGVGAMAASRMRMGPSRVGCGRSRPPRAAARGVDQPPPVHGGVRTTRSARPPRVRVGADHGGRYLVPMPAADRPSP